MTISKRNQSDSPNAMESDDQIDPIDLFMRQAIGREDSLLQCVQLVHPFGQSGLGWPMLTPVKVQLQKCHKCPMEFCSPMNYRRHKLTHRRSINVRKESLKNRELLGAFWDKLSLEEAGRVVSFEDISLEGVSGSLIVDAWTSSLQTSGVLVLPEVYSRAGCILLEIILAKSSRPPISSQQIFSILDETSEGTFLSVGTAESVQKFIIDGGVEKVLELRNLVASTGLLFEKQLVKAWVAEKDSEALRCQMILVEEEEVAQKRQAEALERKQRKKLRQKEQKEQKAKEKSTGEKTNNNADPLDSISFVQGPTSEETSIRQIPFDNRSDTLTDLKSSLQQINFIGKEEDLVEDHCDYSGSHVGMDSTKNVSYHREWATNGLNQPTISTWKVVQPYRRGQVAFLGSQNLKASRLEATQKQGPANEMNIMANSGKVWGRKSKSAIDEESSRITIRNIFANSANDVESSRPSLQNLVATGELNIENSRTTLQDVDEKSSNESSRTSLKNIVSKGEISVESSRTYLQSMVAKSTNDEISRTSWKDIISKGATDVESSRNTLQHVVARIANDVKSSKTSLNNVVGKGETDVESSRTTLQSMVAKSANDVQNSKTRLKNVVANGATDIESSRTTLQNVVVKSLNDERSRTIVQNIVSKSGIDTEKSSTTLQNVVAKSPNGVESSRTSLRNLVAKDAVDVESSATTLQSVVAVGENGLEISRTSLQNVVKGEIGVESSRATLHNIVVTSVKDVESSRTILQNGVERHVVMSNYKLLVGDISVPIRNYAAEEHVSQEATTNSSDKCVKEKHVSQEATTNSSDKCVKSNVILEGEHPTNVDMRGDLHVQKENDNCGENDILGTVEDLTVTRLQSCLAKLNVSIKNIKNSYRERSVPPEGSFFPSFDVKDFLAQRWRDAIASDHVKLVLSPKPPQVSDGGKDGSLLLQTSGGSSQNVKLDDAETSQAGVGPHVSFIKGKSKVKFRKKKM